MAAWRWRQCPACRKVMPAGELLTRWSDDYFEPWATGAIRRVYSDCGFLGRTNDFAVVRERHPEPSQRGGAA
jgi:hypothetical protein